ncbi:MAG: cache domain-containing protein [Marinisporobacter sp.]|jgi:methyl-accepting chemotaxis protein|nr:cache domain-containing protein [Marinisporobacter sp.]
METKKTGMSILNKTFIAISIAVSIPLLISFYMSYNKMKGELSQSAQIQIKSSITYSKGLLYELDHMAKEGVISLEEAQERARLTILGPKNAEGLRDMTQSKVGSNPRGYIYALTKDGDRVMHPYKEGVNIIQEYASLGNLGAALASEKYFGKVYEYEWTNPKTKESFMAYDYAEYFEPWGWIVRSGVPSFVIYGDKLNSLKMFYIINYINLNYFYQL